MRSNTTVEKGVNGVIAPSQGSEEARIKISLYGYYTVLLQKRNVQCCVDNVETRVERVTS